LEIDRRHIATALSVALAVALLFPAIQHLREAPPPPPPTVRLSLTAPPGTELGVGDEPLDAAISPDQREVVFVATQIRRGLINLAPAGVTQLWRRRLDAEESEPIAGTEGARLPAWKQTGRVLSFFADAQLKLLDLKTGAVTVVSDAADPAGATWLRDGSLLFVPTSGVVRRLLDGKVTDATRLASGDTAHAYPVAVAAGTRFIYIAVRGEGRRVVRLSENGQDHDLGTTTAHGAVVAGERDVLLFVKDDTLLADEREPDTGRMAGRDLPVALEVGVTRSGRGLFTASPDVLIHSAAVERPRQLTWLSMDGARAGTVADVGDYWQVRISPDDTRLAVTTRDPLLRSLDVLMISALEAAPAQRLTASLAADTDPVWSPDGRRITFRTTQRGRPELLVTPSAISQGSSDQNPARPLKATGEIPNDWRGGELLVQRRGDAGFDLVRAAESSGEARSVAETPFNETEGRWSPDGRWIAYVSDEPGRPDVYVLHGTTRQRLSLAGGTHPRWTRDSRSLLFLRGSTIMRADLDASGTRFESPRPLFEAAGIRDFDVAHRSDRLLALLPVQIERVSSVPVILNWRSLLGSGQSERPRGRNQRPAPVL
jgi:eukaryotic-like serine/threonine-protein kinase